MDRQIIAALQDLIEGVEGDVAGKLLWDFFDVGIIGKNLHVEAPGAPGDTFCHRAEAQQAQRLEVYVYADDGLLYSF